MTPEEPKAPGANVPTALLRPLAANASPPVCCLWAEEPEQSEKAG